MKTHFAFHEINLDCISPGGWLERYLELQRNGLTGHLEAAGFPFNSGGWTTIEDEIVYRGSWEPYEQTGYWIDGMIRCGYLLKDKFLTDKAFKHLEYVLLHPDSDGYLGPRHLKNGLRANRWVHAVFFRALMAYYSVSGDNSVLESLARHFLSETSPNTRYRDVCNVEIMLWVYEKTGDKRLLEYAEYTYDEYNRLNNTLDTSLDVMLSDRRAAIHGVSFNEICKLGAIMYMYTGNKKYLDASVNAFNKLARDQVLADGVCSSSEELRGKDPLDSHETCNIADYSWSLGYLLLATGNVEYADRIERVCFNAAPGAVLANFKGLQYFSCPNQVIADKTSNHNLYVKGGAWMSYRPSPGTQCCPGDVNRIMPNYIARMWMTDSDGNITASLYGPSRVKFKAGRDHKEIIIIEDTTYPFSDRIDFRINTMDSADFDMNLRIPSWCKNAKILINNEYTDYQCTPGSFIKVGRTFRDRDLVSLILPMNINLCNWPHEGISLERGPLVYSLKIEEKWEIDMDDKRCTEEFPAWNLYPVSPWNYALAIDGENPEDIIEIIQRPCTAEPWSINNAPIEMLVPARRIHGWEIERDKVTEALIDTKEGQKYVKTKGSFTPQLPKPETLEKRLDKKVEKAVLVPYGCTKLRITVFSHCKKDESEKPDPLTMGG